jgi:hypothetical protein
MMPIKYDYVPDENDSTLECIKIMEGKYEGLVYQYGTVSFNENEKNDDASMQFNYRTIKDVEDKDPDEIQQILGDILVDILNEHVDETNDDSSIKLSEVEDNSVLEKQISSVKIKAQEERNDSD